MRKLICLSFLWVASCAAVTDTDASMYFLGGTVYYPQVLNTRPKPPVICAFITGWGVEYYTAVEKNCMCVIQGMVVPVNEMLMVPVMVAVPEACMPDDDGASDD